MEEKMQRKESKEKGQDREVWETKRERGMGLEERKWMGMRKNDKDGTGIGEWMEGERGREEEGRGGNWNGPGRKGERRKREKEGREGKEKRV